MHSGHAFKFLTVSQDLQFHNRTYHEYVRSTGLGKAPTYIAVLLHMLTAVNILRSLLRAQLSSCVLRRCLRKG